MTLKPYNYMIKHAFLQAGLVAAILISLSFQEVNAKGKSPATPEPSTAAQSSVQTAQGSKTMVVTSHPEASRVGNYILSNGGSAADAAIAVQLVLGLVEPQSSGLGGGSFALYYDRASNQVYSFDGRETAPQRAGKFLFTGDDGKPMEFYKAAVGGRAVGVPGTVRLLEMIHKRFGKIVWKDLFTPSVALAEQGFIVTPRLSSLIDIDYDNIGSTTAARLYYMPDASTPVEAGDRLKNPAYARILRTIAMGGADAFYKGQTAETIAKTVREHPTNPGLISIEDMAAYKAIERKTLCGTYRAYMICTMGEPSAGGITVLETLGILENFPLATMGPKDPASWHLIAEASRLAMVDRNYYLGDPGYIQSPGAMLFGKDYTKQRAALITYDKAATTIEPGVPAGWQSLKQVREPVYPKPPGTAHFTIVDQWGNIVSMTSSIEDMFGSRLFVDGFMLNNQLTDFSFTPEIDGKPVANRVEGGKRPRSSMAPIIMFAPDGSPFLVIGSAGGSAIPGYIVQRIVSVVDWQMGLGQALAAPNIINRGSKIEMEAMAAPSFEDSLRGFGHPVEIVDLNSGISAIEFDGGVMTGAADPRREGVAIGQ